MLLHLWVKHLWEEAENRSVNRLTIEPKTFFEIKLKNNNNNNKKTTTCHAY